MRFQRIVIWFKPVRRSVIRPKPVSMLVRRRAKEVGSGTATAMPAVKSVTVRVSKATSVRPGHVVPLAMHGISAGSV